MNRCILRLAFHATLLLYITVNPSQVVIGGAFSGMSFPFWQTSSNRYALGIFAFNRSNFTLESNIFKLPPFTSEWKKSAFGAIEDDYIVLAHGRYLYLLQVKNNQIQKVQHHTLADSDQSYSDVQVATVQGKSYVFVLNSTFQQLYVFSFSEKGLKLEPIYYPVMRGINKLHIIVENNTMYLLATDAILNTLGLYIFENGRLYEILGSPIMIRGRSPRAIISFQQNNTTYICIANQLSNSLSLYSFINGNITEIPNSLSAIIHPNDLLSFTHKGGRYILVGNRTKIHVLTFTNGNLTLNHVTRLQSPHIDMHMHLLEYNDQLYVSVYDHKKSHRIELFRFQNNLLRRAGSTDISPIHITQMQSLSLSQFKLEQTMQTAVPQLPTDVVHLIAQYTVLHKESNFPLEKKRLIDSFVQNRSFNMSQALEFIKSAQQHKLLSPEVNKWRFLFDSLLFPYYMGRYDMQPIQEWITLIKKQNQARPHLQSALQLVNQQLDQTSPFFSPWSWFKLYWLRRKIASSL